MTLQVSAYDPDFVMPYMTFFNIKINRPPKLGELIINHLTGESIKTEFEIKAVGFEDL